MAEGVNKLRRPDNATIVVTHYQRLLNYIVPDFVHVLAGGRIIRIGRQGAGAGARGEGLRLAAAGGAGVSVMHWQSAFAARVGRDEPQWLAPMRRTAMASFSALGFPTSALEDWHYTSLSSIADVPYAMASAGSSTTVADLTPYMINAEWPTVVLLNGVYSPSLSSMDSLPAGVQVMDLTRAWREHPAMLQKHLGKVALAEHAMTALNTGLMQDGVVVYVPKDVVSETPIHILHVADASAAATATFPRTLIVAGQHAKATVLESFVALANVAYFTNHVAEVVVGENATITHTKIQRESELATHVSTTEVHQARDSHYVNFSMAMGSKLSRTNVYTVLDGENCGATLNGLYLGTARSTLIIRRASNTHNRTASAGSSTRACSTIHPTPYSTARCTCTRSRRRPMASRATTPCCSRPMHGSTPSRSSRYLRTT